MGIMSTLKLGILLSILIALGSGYVYVSNMQASLSVALQDNSTLMDSVSSQKHTIESMGVDMSDIRTTNRALTNRVSSLRTELSTLNERFRVSANGTSRDFGDIARAKPVLIQRIINRATIAVNNCIEQATNGVDNVKCKSSH